jgi:hypothetical protein
VFFLDARQVRSAAAAVRAKAVAQCAVDPKFIFAGLGRFSVTGKWIAIVGEENGRQANDQ